MAYFFPSKKVPLIRKEYEYLEAQVLNVLITIKRDQETGKIIKLSYSSDLDTKLLYKD